MRTIELMKAPKAAQLFHRKASTLYEVFIDQSAFYLKGLRLMI